VRRMTGQECTDLGNLRLGGGGGQQSHNATSVSQKRSNGVIDTRRAVPKARFSSFVPVPLFVAQAQQRWPVTQVINDRLPAAMARHPAFELVSIEVRTVEPIALVEPQDDDLLPRPGTPRDGPGF
jgi:hypothetical protein